MRGIGEMARDSGLSASALRFYHGAGVLVPAWVDPVSGYRWYGRGQLEESRLLARLRRAGMPLADIRLVLVRALLECRENPMTLPRPASVQVAVSAPGLAAALDAVRFAASTDPELAMLGGVLFEIENESLQVVATDRYRMALAHAGAAGHSGPRVQVVVPSPLADAMRVMLSGDESVQLTLDGDRVALEAGDRQAAGQCLSHDFPDYRRFVCLPPGHRVLIDVPALREAVEPVPSVRAWCASRTACPVTSACSR